MSGQLQDKIAIVTGSSSGIGEAIAHVFASRGAKVTICGRDKDRLKLVLDKVVNASGGHTDKFLTVQGDLNDDKIRKEIIEQTVAKFGRLDILVANAGISQPNQTIHNTSDETYDKIMNTNLKSVFFLIKHAVPHLEKTNGSIINISAMLSTMVVPFVTVYSTAKAALDHLTRLLAVDLGSKGIRVNSVQPGYLSTKLGRDYGDEIDQITAKMAKLDLQKQALKDRYVELDDVTELVAFLASKPASFITGENIKVDGGRSYGGQLDVSMFNA